MVIFFFYLYDEEAGTTVPVPVDDKNLENDEELEFFFDDKVRKVWHKQEEEWYFSVTDVCQVLTDSADGRKYWNKLKQRLKEEGNETVTNCHQLKMKAVDGKMRKTDVASTEQLLRIIQSIPSKKAETFKMWLTQINEKHALSEISKSDERNSYTETLFESIKHINGYGNEFWYARELQKALEYTQWRRFEEAIDRAKNACENSGNIVSEHFVDVGKSSPMPNGGERIINDYELSRYACYLIVQNGDSRKKVIALGQTYFAIKTRQQELAEAFINFGEDKKRLSIRNEIKSHNKSLAEAAKMAGVSKPKDYAIFQNKGYQGLYGGLGRKEIHAQRT